MRKRNLCVIGLGLVTALTGTLLLMSSMVYTPIPSASGEESLEDLILNYFINEYVPTTTFADAASVKIVSTGTESLYEKEMFHAMVQVDPRGIAIEVFVDPETSKIYPHNRPTFEELYDTKLSFLLWKEIQNKQIGDMISAIVYLKHLEGMRSVTAELPYDKLNAVNGKLASLESMLEEAESTGSPDTEALRKQIQDVKQEGYSLAAEISALRAEIVQNNRALEKEIHDVVVPKISSISGVEIIEGFRPSSMVSVTATVDAISEIAEIPEVVGIGLNYVPPLELNVSRPTTLAQAFHDDGITGSGTNVTIIDTGVVNNHPNIPVPYPEYPDNFTTCVQGFPSIDQFGHGTEVAGVIFSTHTTYKGMASDSNLISAKYRKDLSGFPGGALEHLNCAVDFAEDKNSDLINFSTSSVVTGADDGNSEFSKYLDFKIDSIGLFIAQAAGNTNRAPPRAAGYNTVVVGAASDQGDEVRITDVNATFTACGPTPDGRKKPDISAPGTAITTTSLSGGFITWDGTSYATPHVAGTAALLKSDRPWLAPLHIKAILLSSSNVDRNPTQLGSSGDFNNCWGWGYLNADRADNSNTLQKTITHGSIDSYFFNGNNQRTSVALTWLRHMVDQSIAKPVSNLDLQVFRLNEPVKVSIDLSSDLNDNVELVSADLPIEGIHRVDVTAVNVPTSVSPQTFVLSVTEKAASPPVIFLKGDADLNGSVDIFDMIAIGNHIVGGQQLTIDGRAAADVYPDEDSTPNTAVCGDGIIDIFDQIAVGNAIVSAEGPVRFLMTRCT
jgi:subtilisin family serine protease